MVSSLRMRGRGSAPTSLERSGMSFILLALTQWSCLTQSLVNPARAISFRLYKHVLVSVLTFLGDDDVCAHVVGDDAPSTLITVHDDDIYDPRPTDQPVAVDDVIYCDPIEMNRKTAVRSPLDIRLLNAGFVYFMN